MDQDQNKLIIPGAILIAGALIAGAVYFGAGDRTPQQAQVGGALPDNQPTPEVAFSNTDFSEDYIFGNPEAPIKLVEYSDLNCRFCKAFHPTMKRVMEEYGESGQVAWIYRHFAVLGDNSVKEAQALECAGELGGSETFWQYLDYIFTDGKNDGAQWLPGESIETAASAVGLNPQELTSCVESGKYAEKVQGQTQTAISSGGRGTPYTLLVHGEGNAIPISGAQPFENVRSTLDGVLSSL